MSNSNDEITMQLGAEALISVLRSSSSSISMNLLSNASSDPREEEVVVMLAKKNEQPLLSFEISGVSRLGKNFKVSHDLRIELLRRSDVEPEPLCPEPDVRIVAYLSCFLLIDSPTKVHVLLPPLLKLRTIVERLKLMSNILVIQANNNKQLKLSIRTDNVDCETVWTNCSNPDMRTLSCVFLAILSNPNPYFREPR